MRGGEAPRRPESYQGDFETQDQEEAPLQRTSNFVCTPIIKQHKAKVHGPNINSRTQSPVDYL